MVYRWFRYSHRYRSRSIPLALAPIFQVIVYAILECGMESLNQSTRWNIIITCSGSKAAVLEMKFKVVTSKLVAFSGLVGVFSTDNCVNPVKGSMHACPGSNSVEKMTGYNEQIDKPILHLPYSLDTNRFTLQKTQSSVT